MAKFFYDHLIIIEEIIAVAGNDKKMLGLVDKILQNEILDVILTYLPRPHHEEFLQKFHAAPHDTKLLQYLADHSPVNIELAILDRANKTKKKILATVKKHTHDRKT